MKPDSRHKEFGRACDFFLNSHGAFKVAVDYLRKDAIRQLGSGKRIQWRIKNREIDDIAEQVCSLAWYHNTKFDDCDDWMQYPPDLANEQIYVDRSGLIGQEVL